VVFGNVKPLIIKKGKHPKVKGKRLKTKSLKNGSLNTQMVNNDNENYNLFHTKNQPRTLFNIQGTKSNTTINQINSISLHFPYTNKFNSNIHEPISYPYPIEHTTPNLIQLKSKFKFKIKYILISNSNPIAQKIIFNFQSNFKIPYKFQMNYLFNPNEIQIQFKPNYEIESISKVIQIHHVNPIK
jgi:hypothetical protein